MTKKFFYASLAVMAILPLASCTNEEAPVVEGNGISLTVQLPDKIESRQFSTGLLATQLQYAVYESGKKIPLEVCPVGDGTYTKYGTATFVDRRTTVNLQLVDNKTYDIVFWAQNPNAPYQFNAEGQYVVTNFSGVRINDDNLDAFTNHITVNNQGKPFAQDVYLYRPFAQVNIGTDDIAIAKAGQLALENASVMMPSYSALNLMNKEVGAVQNGEFVAALPTDDIPGVVFYGSNSLPDPDVDMFPVTGYEYLTMNYLLVPEDKTNIDITLLIDGANWKTFNNIPVQRNHRTNIFGSLLTNPAVFNVIIEERFDVPDYDILVWNGGTEKPADPVLDPETGKRVYTINNPQQLAYISSIPSYGSYTYKITADMDFGQADWKTLELVNNGGSASFDFQGHALYNLNAPLFGCGRSSISCVNVKNLRIVNANISKANFNNWGPLGDNFQGNIENITIENCTINVNSVKEDEPGWTNPVSIGGLNGKMGGYYAKNCTINGLTINVSNTGSLPVYIGGLFGTADDNDTGLTTTQFHFTGNVLNNITVNVDSASCENVIIAQFFGRVGWFQCYVEDSTVTNFTPATDKYCGAVYNGGTFYYNGTQITGLPDVPEFVR